MAPDEIRPFCIDLANREPGNLNSAYSVLSMALEEFRDRARFEAEDADEGGARLRRDWAETADKLLALAEAAFSDQSACLGWVVAEHEVAYGDLALGHTPVIHAEAWQAVEEIAGRKARTETAYERPDRYVVAALMKFEVPDAP